MNYLLFDLNGTTVDCGCLAPIAAIAEAFRRRGVPIDPILAKDPSGQYPLAHVERILADPGLKREWERVTGLPPAPGDGAAIWREAEACQSALAPLHADPIPGFAKVIADFRGQGIRVGATSTDALSTVEVMRPNMSAKGWTPDVIATATDAPSTPPAPYIHQLAAMRLGAPSVSDCVAIGDTPADMQAARNAGMWAVGVTLTGSAAGLPWTVLRDLSSDDRARLRDRAAPALHAAGAHVLIDTVLDTSVALDLLRRPSLAAFRRWQRRR